MSATPQEDLSDILEFVRQSNGQFLSSHCIIKASPLGGLGVFAIQDIHKGRVLLRIPKNAIFSSSNSSVANLLLDEEVDGMLALNIAFIYETTVFKERSHWYPYLKSIRIHDETGNLYLPPSCWSAEEKNALKGTTIDTLYDALAPQEELEEGFEIAVNLAMKWNEEFGLEIPQDFLSVENEERIKEKYLKFVAVAYAISSRVFEIDNYHESALVPIADLFNHHVTSPDVRFESLYEVCPLCGEVGECRHLIAEAKLMEIEEEKQVAHLKGAANGNIDMSLISQLEADQENSDSSDSDSDESDDEEMKNNSFIEARRIRGVLPEECVDITTTNFVKSGMEIFNSYGDLSNAFLLARYGFCIEQNPYDVINLAPEILKFKKQNKRKFQERFEWWSEVGYELYSNWHYSKREEGSEPENSKNNNIPVKSDSEDEDESEEDEEADAEELKSWLSEMCVDANGEPTNRTLALMKLLSLKETEWRKFIKDKDNVDKMWKKIELLDRKNDRKTYSVLCEILKLKKSLASPPISNAYLQSNIRILIDSENRILSDCINKYRPSTS